MSFAADIDQLPGLFDRPAISDGVDEEQVQRAALWILSRNIEAMIQSQEATWKARDASFGDEMGITIPATDVIRVDAENFYEGARPSMIEAPPSKWPNITVRAQNARPSTSQPDQYDAFDLDLYVEVLCAVGPFPHVHPDHDPEGEINRQVHRLSNAAHMCIRANPSLGGLVNPIQRPPNTRLSLPWVRPEEDGAGQDYIFQGKQYHYVVSKLSF